MKKRFIFTITLTVAALFISGIYAPAKAQNSADVPKLFQTPARAADAVTLRAGANVIRLWGASAVTSGGPVFDLQARTAIDDLIGGQKIQCETKGQLTFEILAQCENQQGLDLGLAMIQKGFATVDRAVIYDTGFETVYLDAEQHAQSRKAGIWGSASSASGEGGGYSSIILIGSLIFIALLLAFAALSFFIFKGFRRVTDVQEANTEMISRERALKDKEREIFAMMLDSEIKSNKSKIEAYLVVYEEMLKSLHDPERVPVYKKAGDIVQAQPVLDRAVFDRNTDKLDILGEKLSSEVIHFYARIKSKPDYITLDPDMPIDEAISVVETALKSGQRLDKIADRLIDRFNVGGHSEHDLKLGDQNADQTSENTLKLDPTLE